MDRTGRTAAVTLALLLTLAVLPGAASAVRAPADRGLANVDRRAALAASVPAATKVARRDLERDLGKLADVRTQRSSGAVAYVGSPTGLLTGPSSDDPREIALSYVRDNADVFGLTGADIANLRLVARDVSPDGITHLRFNQMLDGIESFDSGLEAHVTRDGRLITLSGSPLAHARLTARTPALSASRGARRRAHRRARLDRAAEGHAHAPRSGARHDVRHRRAGAAALGRDRERPAAGVGRHRRRRGRPRLRRARRRRAAARCCAARASPSTSARRATSPATPTTPHRCRSRCRPRGTTTMRTGRGCGASTRAPTPIRTNEDPEPGDELGGTRVQVPATAGAPGSPDWIYPQSHAFAGATPCPTTGCTWNSDAPATASVNAMQAATNLHVLNSRFHDHLAAAPIGFDAASGNFQRTNPAGQGLGNDYVRSEVNDGQGLNNANMSTVPDGNAPRMQMFLFSARDVNGSDIADIVYHEYTHGLSARLIVNAERRLDAELHPVAPDGRGVERLLRARPAAGRGIGDRHRGRRVRSSAATTSSGRPGSAPSRSTARSTRPARRRRAMPTTPPTTVLGGYTYGDLANTSNGTPHNGGEVWAQTLWDIRRARRAHGRARAGHRRHAPVARRPVDARHARRDPAAGARDAQRRRRTRRPLRHAVGDLRGARLRRQRHDADRGLDEPDRELRRAARPARGRRDAARPVSRAATPTA